MPRLVCLDHGKRSIVTAKNSYHRENGSPCESADFKCGKFVWAAWELNLIAGDAQQKRERQKDLRRRLIRDEVSSEERLLMAIFGK